MSERIEIVRVEDGRLTLRSGGYGRRMAVCWVILGLVFCGAMAFDETVRTWSVGAQVALQIGIVALTVNAALLSLRFSAREADTFVIDPVARTVTMPRASGVTQRQRWRRTDVVHDADIICLHVHCDALNKYRHRKGFVVHDGAGGARVAFVPLDWTEVRTLGEMLGLRVLGSNPGWEYVPPGLVDDPALRTRPFLPSVEDPPGYRDAFWKALARTTVDA